MSVEPQNIQWPTRTPYLEGDRGTGAWGVEDISPFIPEVVVASEFFEVDPISGSGTWTLTASSPHTGLRCLRSAVIGSNQQTNYTFNVPPGANFIRFWHRVSSELNFDFFRVLVDAVQVFQLSGTANVWAQSIFSVAGASTVTFRYIKDGSSSVGLDAAFIDDIDWLASEAVAAVEVYEPLHLNTNHQLKTTTVLEDPVAITGIVETRPLTCETDSVTVCIDEPLEVEVIGSVDVILDEPIDVNVLNFPASVEISNDVGNPVPVSFARLSCTTDSVEICNDIGNPIPVSVTNFPTSVEISNDVGNPVPVSFTRLNCATDSVEICNDVGSPITVNVTNTVTFTQGRRSLRGVYFATSGPLAYTTAADAATGGDLWLTNTSNTVVIYLREVRYTSNIAALALLTALPIIRMERMSFTTAPSGPLVTPAKRDTLDFANTGTLRTTNAGMGVITAGAGIKSFAPPSSDIIGGLLAANASSAVPAEQLFVADIDSFIVLRQNEGIVFRQATAGSATENRQYQVDIIWEEI